MKDGGPSPPDEMLKLLKQFGPIVVTLGLLAYLAGFARLEIVTRGVNEYMARSKSAIEALPLQVGKWSGERKAIEDRARELLKPNAESSILYTMYERYVKYQASYSVIQAADSRFMTGHAPSNCYPGTGWEITRQVNRVWRVGEFDINGTEYVVQRPGANGRMDMLNIRNFFIFPDGHFGSSLGELDAAASDYRKLKYGVAQVQLLTGVGVTEKQRDEIFSTLVGSERSLEMIRILRTGIPK